MFFQVKCLTDQLQELKKKDLNAQIKCQQSRSRLEILRSHIIQLIFSTSGAVRPEIKLDDDHIIKLIQKVEDEFLHQSVNFIVSHTRK